MVAKFLIGAVLLATAAPAYAAEQEFVLVNKTGKTIKIAASKAVKFKPGKGLRDAVNG